MRAFRNNDAIQFIKEALVIVFLASAFWSIPYCDGTACEVECGVDHSQQLP